MACQLVIDGAPPAREPQKISDTAARAIRARSTVLGLISLVASMALAITVVATGYELPTSYNPVTIMMVGSIANFFTLLGSIALLGGRSYFSPREQNIRQATKARRVILVMLCGAVFSSVLSVFFLNSMIKASGGFSNQPQLHYTSTFVAYLVLLLAPVAVAAIQVITGRYLLRPAPSFLRKHGM